MHIAGRFLESAQPQSKYFRMLDATQWQSWAQATNVAPICHNCKAKQIVVCHITTILLHLSHFRYYYIVSKLDFDSVEQNSRFFACLNTVVLLRCRSVACRNVTKLSPAQHSNP